ncbi:MAG: heme ABC transporter substrate-binding protein IsdE [Peptococcaceae bacterium]|nr:heme ABC transporter substrate-binding protein IsdE [Peptococcaceae bacterium]
MRSVKRIFTCLLLTALLLSLCACVDQHPGEPAADSDSPAAKAVSGQSEEENGPRVVATSNATLHICDRLGLDLVAICATSGKVPERYQGLPEIGTAMSPDAEAIALLEPTDVVGPEALAETIEPTYQAAGVPYTFIDLQSVQGMYESIAMLGEKYGAQDAADPLIAEYEETLADFLKSIEGKEQPRVLVLMGLPGAYIECTPNSYVGSLVELAGAENVVQVDTIENFVSWNTEDLLDLDPDVILLTAHGLPDLAMEMFAEEFATNDIWKHFRAVEEKKVYQLDYALFGMSCTLDWPKALDVLREILYDGTYQPYDAEGAYLENNS